MIIFHGIFSIQLSLLTIPGMYQLILASNQYHHCPKFLSGNSQCFHILSASDSRLLFIDMNKIHHLVSVYPSQWLSGKITACHPRDSCRDVLFEFHLKFWDTASIAITIRSLLWGRQTSNWSNCSTKRINCLMVFK